MQRVYSITAPSDIAGPATTVNGNSSASEGRLGIQQSVEPSPTLDVGRLVADDKTLEPEVDIDDPNEPTRPDPADGGDANGSSPSQNEDFTMNFSKIESNDTALADDGAVIFTTDTVDYSASQDLLSEPEVDIGDPNVPTEPDPGDAEGQTLIYGPSASEDYVDQGGQDDTEIGGGDIYLIDLVGSSASEMATSDDFVFELEPSGDPNEPTRPDPGDAEGEALIFGLSASEDYYDPSAREDTTVGEGGDFVMVDIVGASSEPEPAFDDFLFG